MTPKEIEARLEAIVRNRTVDHIRRVTRLEDGAVDELMPHLEQAVREIEKKLAKRTKETFTVKRERALAAWIREVVKNRYNPGAREAAVADELASIAQDESRAMSSIISFDGKISGASFVGLTNNQAKAMLRMPAAGSRLRSWIDDLGEATATQLHRQAAQGWLFGETNEEIAARFSTTLNGARGRAGTLARTWTQEIANRARWGAIEKNKGLVNAVEWSAVLGRRTCPLCGPLHGRVFALEPTKGVQGVKDIPNGVGGPRPPRHPHCRCGLIPHVESWSELLGVQDEQGLRKIEGQYPKYKAVRGQLRRSPDYWDWLKKQPKRAQLDHLGQTRLTMIKSGQIDYQDILNRQGGTRTIKQLKALARRRA